MKRTTRARRRHLRRESKAEAARRLDDMLDGREIDLEEIRQEAARIERINSECNVAWLHREMDSEYDAYYEPWDDDPGDDFWEFGYDDCPHCHLGDVLRRLGTLVPYLTYEDRLELSVAVERIERMIDRATLRRDLRRSSVLKGS